MIKKIFARKGTVLICFAFWVVIFSTFLFSLSASHGYSLKTLFFRRTEDFIMDFANSIRDSSGNDVYSYFESLYPPIAILYFRFLSLFYNPEVLDRDISQYFMWEEPMLHVQFISFVVICYLCLYFAIHRKLKGCSLFTKLFTFLFVGSSFPFLYAIERGNIILFTAVMVIFFACCYKDENKVVNELAIIALALAITTKLYPIVFAVLIIKKRDLLSLVKAGIYSVFLIIFPFCFYGGFAGLHFFIFKPFSYFSRSISELNSNIKLILYHAGIIDSDSFVFKYISYVAIAFFCILAFFAKKDYLSLICCSLALLHFTGAEGNYAAVFMFPGFIFLLREKKLNIFEFVCALWFIFEYTVMWLFNADFSEYQRIKVDIISYPVFYALVLLLFITGIKLLETEPTIDINKGEDNDMGEVEMKDDSYYGLKEYHQFNLEIMDEIDRICRKYDIKYILLYGSLIGAARHQGFIPWDDDFDIGFLRVEYEKFMSHVDEIDPKFKIVGEDTFDNKFWDSTTRLVYLGKKVDESSELTKYFDELHNYIFVDLFVFDDVKEGISFKMQSFRNKMLYGYAMSRRPKLTMQKYDSFLAKMLAFTLSKTGKLFKFKKILAKKEKNMKKNNGKSLTMCSTFGGFPAVFPTPVKKSYFEDIIELPFEGRNYYCPKEYDEMLQIDFKDWRTPPKEEDRVATHHNMVL